MKTCVASQLTRRTALTGLSGLPIVAGTILPASAQAPTSPATPLASWNESASKRAIMDFVARVTHQGGADYVAPAERVAVFDNDGTLWTEHPMYVQLALAPDRVKALAPLHPEWKNKQPFQAVLDGDMEALAASGERGMMELVMVTHAGMTNAEFAGIVTQWLATARHPRFKRPYTELVYQPMIELLGYLRAHGFKSFIVSGGGVEFMRLWTERVYGVPPEQVVGSSIKTRFEMRDGRPELFRLAEMNFIDDKTGKPVGINEYIGRRPIAAFGNSDGDLEMLQWTTLSGGVRLGMLVHHTDAEQEYAYDRNTAFGRLDTALDAAAADNWSVIDMKKDWKVIFPFDLH
ncbi:HAD family hydrolase [Methylobacterium sp. P5_C11]